MSVSWLKIYFFFQCLRKNPWLIFYHNFYHLSPTYVYVTIIILLNQVPPEIVSTNEALLVRFKSDDTINSKGFSAAYVAIDENENEDLPKSQQSVRYN